MVDATEISLGAGGRRYEAMEFTCAGSNSGDFRSLIAKHEKLQRRLKGVRGLLVYRNAYQMPPAQNQGDQWSIHGIWVILLNPSLDQMVMMEANKIGLDFDESKFITRGMVDAIAQGTARYPIP